MIVIGITGGAGAGKSLVLEYLSRRHKAVVCQADLIARKLQEPGGECYAEIVREFGEGILLGDGALDRRKLADLIFSDPDARRRINKIVHPAVKRRIQAMAEEERRKNTFCFVIESALLLDDGYDAICDEIWYIYADEGQRRERLRASRNYSAKKSEAVFASQLTDSAFRKKCDRVIDNSGSIDAVYRCLDDRMEHIKKEKLQR